MRRSHQIALPTDDYRGSLVTQIHALRRALGKSPAVLNRAVKKQFGVGQGIDGLDERQLAAVLSSLELLMQHAEEVERVHEACADSGITRPALEELLEIHFEGRELSQLSVEELTELRLLVESRGNRAAAAREQVVEVVM